MMCGSGGSKSRLAKVAGAQPRSHLVRWEMTNCMPSWCEARFEVKMLKTACSRSTFGSWDVCVPLWREAHIEVKMVKALRCRSLEVQLLKKCMALWREAHFEVKTLKNWRSRTNFGSWDVEKVQLQLRLQRQLQLHYATLHYTTLRHTTLITLHGNYN